MQSGGADPRDAEEAAAAQTGTRGIEAPSVERSEAIDESSLQCWPPVFVRGVAIFDMARRGLLLYSVHCYDLFSRFFKAGSFLTQREW